MSEESGVRKEQRYLPVCHDCKVDLTHPRDNREAAERAAERHRDRMEHAAGVRTVE